MPRVVSVMPAAVAEDRRDHRLERLAECVQRLDPGTRALLDLSVRRRLRDDAMAPLLHTDAFHLAWRRARALERVASDLGGDQPVPLAQVRAALETLPAEAWDPLSRPALMAPRAVAPAVPEAPKAEAPVADEPEPEAEVEPEAEAEVVTEESDAITTTALVPAPSTDIAAARPSLGTRLDAFATSAPTLREAFGDVGRAIARKAVRLVVWRRRAA